MEVILDTFIQKKYQIKDKNQFNYDIIEKNLKDISFNNIVNCLEQIIIYKNKLQSVLNLNINLFIDRFVIDVSEVLE